MSDWYVKKPVKVRAFQYIAGSDRMMWPQWLKDGIVQGVINVTAHGVMVSTPEGAMVARHTDWIICGIAGEFYPCRPDIFKRTYEPCDSEEAA